MEMFAATLNVEFALLPSFGQRRGVYRPNHKHPLTGEFFMGQVTFHDGHVDSGTKAGASIRLWLVEDDYNSLVGFGSWSVWEGPINVGHVQIVG